MRKPGQFTPDEDTPLLLSWYRGDLSAFETLIWRYHKRIFNLALLLTGIQKTACEITVNAFITAYQNIKALKSTDRFSSWIVTLALKECRMLNDYRTEEPESPSDIEINPDDENSYAAALQKKLELCIRELPFELRELILLRYVRVFPLDRIKEILQINSDILLSRLFEAQETLACWLKSGTEDPADLLRLKAEVSSIHPEIRRNFSAYLDNSIESEEKEFTKEHLKSCGSCREALAELEWMAEDIKSIPDIEPPHWLASSIMQKIKSYPVKPLTVTPSSHFRIQIGVALLFIAVIGISSYLLQRSPEPELERTHIEKKIISPQVVEEKPEPVRPELTPILKGGFSKNVPATKSAPPREAAPPPSVPLPAALPYQSPDQPPPSIKALTLPAAGQKQQVQKKEKPEVPLLAPREWGDPLPQSRITLEKPPLPGTKVGELAIVLNSTDPVAAAHDIESAVTSVGGKINGRAYSGGVGIFYTKVEINRFFDLMGRLGKIGVIQELPQLPEDAEGAVDLVIKWK